MAFSDDQGECVLVKEYRGLMKYMTGTRRYVTMLVSADLTPTTKWYL